MSSFSQKILTLCEHFSTCTTADERYRLLIDLGRTLSPYPPSLKTASFQVPGCQSVLYLSSRFEKGKIFFEATADALISAGLAALLIRAYSGESPETVLHEPPTFLAELGILGSLTPSRSNGLAHIHQRMKKDALQALLDFNLLSK
jgi:cysteine desulfuration protein SufE